MTSKPAIHIVSEDKIGASVNAKVELQNRILEENNRLVGVLIKQLETTNQNLQLLAQATETGFINVNNRITEESKKNRTTTKIWSSFGFGMLAVIGRTFLDKFGDIWNRLF